MAQKNRDFCSKSIFREEYITIGNRGPFPIGLTIRGNCIGCVEGIVAE